uniref:Uncharacterized protein n=1 Tax=Arundo donax TaxID=35708 RepID=A0A0A9B211_ARUDO
MFYIIFHEFYYALPFGSELYLWK